MELTPHPSWQIIDSTKIQTYMRCPRKFFFNYVLGWRRVGSNLHIEFGRAIHDALEWHNKKIMAGMEKIDQQHIFECMMAFMNTYRETQPADSDDYNQPKDPVTAETLLNAYMQEYGNEDLSTKIIETEIAGRIAIAKGKHIYFKMDRLQRDDRGTIVMDYKTGSQQGKTWIAQWDQKFQVGTYTYAAKMIYPDTWGMIIRGLFVYKANSTARPYGTVDFLELDLYRDQDDMLEWLNQAETQYDNIMRDFDLLQMVRAGEPYMKAFEKRTESCTDYGGCPYADVCSVWHNPVGRGRPESFEVDFWDPADNIKSAKVQVDL